MFAYSAFGLRIASYLELPELSGLAADPAPAPDVLIQAAPVCPACPPVPADGFWPAFIFSDRESIFLSLHGAGKFELRGGRLVNVAPESGAEAATLRVYLTGLVLALVLYQRGRRVFHASVVESAGGAIAFLGEKNAGKSTLAALLQAEGFSLLADDILVLTPNDAENAAGDGPGAPLLALSGFPRLKLRPDVAHWLHRDTSAAAVPESGQPGKIARSADWRFCAAPALPLRGVYLLEEGHPARLEPLAAGDAIREILPHWYGAQFGLPAIEAIGRQRFLADSAELARRVPVRRLIRPKDFSLTGHVARLLRHDLSSMAMALDAPGASAVDGAS